MADEPVFADPFHPTADEREAWEAWRDAKADAKAAFLLNESARQGFPTPDPRPGIVAAQAKSDVGSAGASRSNAAESVMAFDGDADTVHVTDHDHASASEAAE
jgi:hypothetical protein